MVNRKGLGQANILCTNNNTSTGYGIVYADEVSGHRTVGRLADLYALHDWQLSASGDNTGSDAIGQLWYVVNADGNGNGCYYQLKDWSKRNEAAGWSIADYTTKAELQDKIDIIATADEEDITAEGDTPQTQVLKLKDRAYDSLNASGKGYKILRKNWQQINGERKNVLTQAMINEPNTIYEIRYDFDLNGAEIQIKEGCVLNFVGGSLDNGKINFNGCYINANSKCFNENLNICYIKNVWEGPYNEDLTEDSDGFVVIKYKNLPNNFFYRSAIDFQEIKEGTKIKASDVLELNKKIYSNPIKNKYIDPLWFAEKDSYTLQRMVDFADSSSIHVILLQNFEYSICSTIKLRNNTIFVGNGTKQYKGSGQYTETTNLKVINDIYTVFYGIGKRGVNLKHLTLSCNEDVNLNNFFIEILNVGTHLEDVHFLGNVKESAFLGISTLYTKIDNSHISIIHSDKYRECGILFREDLGPSSAYYGTNFSVIRNTNISAYCAVCHNGGLLYLDNCDIETGYGEDGVINIGEYKSSSSNLFLLNSYIESTPLNKTNYPNTGTDFPSIIKISSYNTITIENSLIYAQSVNRGTIFKGSKSNTIACTIIAKNNLFARANYVLYNLDNNKILFDDSNKYEGINFPGFFTTGFSPSETNYVKFLKDDIYKESGAFVPKVIGNKGSYLPINEGAVFNCSKNSIIEYGYKSINSIGMPFVIYGNNITLKNHNQYSKIINELDIKFCGIGYKDTPKIICQGNNVSLIPCFKQGKLKDIFIENGGYNVPSNAIATIENIGNEVDAEIELVVTNGTVTDVNIINEGDGYNTAEANFIDRETTNICLKIVSGSIVRAYVTNSMTLGFPYYLNISITNPEPVIKEAILNPVLTGAIRTYSGKDIVVKYNEMAMGFVAFDGDLYIYSVFHNDSSYGIMAYAPNSLTSADIGRTYYDTNNKVLYIWDGEKWRNAIGIPNGAYKTYGTYDKKPNAESGVLVGQSYFCTDKQTTEGASNGIVIYYKGNNIWVDALGRIVDDNYPTLS